MYNLKYRANAVRATPENGRTSGNISGTPHYAPRENRYGKILQCMDFAAIGKGLDKKIIIFHTCPTKPTLFCRKAS